MLVDRAQASRLQRYDRWYALLEEEIELIAGPHVEIIAVGRIVAQQLERRKFPRSFTTVIHYSGLNGKARSAGILGREDEFYTFLPSVSEEELLDHASDVLEAAHIPLRFRDETMSRLKKSSLTTSRLQLMFNYKLAFEAICARVRASKNSTFV